MGIESEDTAFLGLFAPIESGQCEICGERHIVDSCTLIEGFTDHICDTPTLSYARLTLPDGLEVRELSDGSKTVITTKPISKGLKFGPFIAKTSTLIDVRIEFPIKVFLNESESVYLETYEEIFCNWMCLVLPASSAEEQNMICFQVKGSIYFCSLRNIEKGEELRVWYAPYYAEKMGAHSFPRPSKLIHSSDEEFQEIFESLQRGIEMQDHQYLPKLRKRRRPPKKLMHEENYYREMPPDVLPGELLGAERRSEWECSTCGQVEENVAAFARHLRTHLRLSKPSLRCPHCKVNFRKDISYRIHLEICNKKALEKNSNAKNLSDLGLNQTIYTVKVVNPGAAISSDVISVDDNNVTSQSVNVDISKNLHPEAFTNCKPDSSSIDTSKSMDLANNAWNISERHGETDKSETIATQSACLRPEDKIDKNKNCKFQQLQNGEENMEENLIVKSHLNPPILDLSDDIDFHLTKSFDEMISDDCNLKHSRTLDLFGTVEPSLIPPDVTNPHNSSLESTSFYSLEKNEFLQTDFATCNDVTDEERNRIVEKLLTETEDNFFASDYEITDGCCSDNAKVDQTNEETHANKVVTRDNQSKPGGDFKCDICSKAFTKSIYLYRHLRKHTGEFKCNSCFMVFARNENLQNHRRSCSIAKDTQDSIRQMRIVCKYCRLQFYSLSSLHQHMEEHYCSGDTWSCRCHLISNSAELFLTHNCPFSNGKTCTLCGKKFNSQKEFIEHKNYPTLRTHVKPDRSLLCEFCGIMHTSITGARLHRHRHHEKTYSCSTCGERFSRMDGLVIHSQKHENVLWECPICLKKLKSEKGLSHHQKSMHTEPSHTCRFCDKIHGKSVFQCEDCQEVFTQKLQLCKHRSRHLRYQCAYCKVQCRYRSSLKRHLAAFHKDKSKEWDNTQFLTNVQQVKVSINKHAEGREEGGSVPTVHNASASNILQTAADDLMEEDNVDDPDEAMEDVQMPDISQLTTTNLVTTMADGNTQNVSFDINVLQGTDDIQQLVSLDGEVLSMPVAFVQDIPSPSGLTTLDDQCPVVMNFPVVLPDGCLLLNNDLVTKQPSEDDSTLINISDIQTISGSTSAFILTDESVSESDQLLSDNVLYYVIDPAATESME
ncbi:uncharacterized protein LOC128985678 isoform X1 [Macrosteles quadrilineatus]|uniref:uncharacterized protein LOC128985678 isoform X1 n=1 Tax=Macrosteles quadrilineatus TaxID=74068 RepID=UPI0023E0A229|nr:uncharacterized protein LOC128985678 isoform X1 [Macrosteles quadrilineatus]